MQRTTTQSTRTRLKENRLTCHINDLRVNREVCPGRADRDESRPMGGGCRVRGLLASEIQAMVTARHLREKGAN